MNDRLDLTPVALYARVSSDRQDVDLSIAAQLRALRDYAEKHDYLVAREYVDEAESGRIADRPEFQKMLNEAAKPEAPFKEILVWKFSRFTRKREHAVAFKSMLRRRGVRVVSITEQADDTPTGKLLEAIIESVDEFYSENLAQEVTRGMREAASRGFWMTTYAPYGYKRVHVQDGAAKRPKLELNPPADAVVRRVFDMVLQGKSILDVTKTLNAEGIPTTNGKKWLKTTIHTLSHEAYAGTVVWGANAKDGAPPVRVEDAHPAIVSKRDFQKARRLLGSRAPKKVNPRRASSPYLLSGALPQIAQLPHKSRACLKSLARWCSGGLSLANRTEPHLVTQGPHEILCCFLAACLGLSLQGVGLIYPPTPVSGQALLLMFVRREDEQLLHCILRKLNLPRGTSEEAIDLRLPERAPEEPNNIFRV